MSVFLPRYLPYQGLPLRVCRGGGGGRGMRDFVVPPIHKKSQISLLLGRKEVLQTGGGRV